MIERFVDVAGIRACAEFNGPKWAEICHAADHHQAIDMDRAADIVQSLLATGVNALPLLIRETVQAIAAGLPRATYHPAMQAIRHEFALLAKCDIHPSLYMHRLASIMTTARGIEAPPAACFFLPVIPHLSGEGKGGNEFFAATLNHLNNFNRGMLRFLKGDETAIHDIRVSLIAIKHRQPKDPYFTPIAIGAAFLAAVADKALPLNDENKLLFSRIGAVVKAAMTEAPLQDHSVTSRLAHAIAHCTGRQKRVELLANQLELKALLDTNAPQISEFPPADVFAAAFGEASDAWKAYMANGLGKQQLAQTVDMLRLISGNNADLKKLAEAFKKLTSAVSSRQYETARTQFDHVTQFMARYFDAVATRDAAVVACAASEEWAAALEIEQFGATSTARGADASAHLDVAREATLDVRMAKDAFIANDGPRAIELLRQLQAIVSFIGLPQAGATAELLLTHVENHAQQPHENAHKGILLAFDGLGRYLDIVYVRPDEAPRLLSDIAERHLKSQPRDDSMETASDREMFEIFLEEAGEVIENIFRITPDGQPITLEADATAIRRGFHTLKGSSRMVGLHKLGGLMAEVENLFDSHMASPPPYPAALSSLARDAAHFALKVCEAIAADGEAPFNSAAITAQVAGLRKPIA